MISSGEPQNRDKNPKRTADNFALRSGPSNACRSRLAAILDADPLKLINDNLELWAIADLKTYPTLRGRG